MLTKRELLRSAALAAAALGTSSSLPALAQAGVTAAEARSVAEDAYLYGYSLITTEVTRIQGSNVAKPEGIKAPTGQFGHVPRYPAGDFRLVSAPNADSTR